MLQGDTTHSGDDDISDSTEGSHGDSENPLHLFNSKAERELGISKTGFPIEPATKENPDFLKAVSGLIRKIRNSLSYWAHQIRYTVKI